MMEVREEVFILTPNQIHLIWYLPILRLLKISEMREDFYFHKISNTSVTEIVYSIQIKQ